MQRNEQFDPEVPEWVEEVAQSIRECWHEQGLNQTINWIIEQDDVGEIWIKAAPTFQEIYGGEQDGEVVWTPFLFDFGEFQQAVAGILEIKNFAIASYNQYVEQQPMLMIEADHQGTTVNISIHLEPPHETGAAEVIDTIKNEVRIKETS